MLDAQSNPQSSGNQLMYAQSINEFKLKSGLIIPAGSFALITPLNLTTAIVQFEQETYSVNLTDLHKWFDEFKSTDMQDLEVSQYLNGWPVEILAK